MSRDLRFKLKLVIGVLSILLSIMCLRVCIVRSKVIYEIIYFSIAFPSILFIPSIVIESIGKKLWEKHG